MPKYGSDDNDTPLETISEYPDTAETGETYDVELRADTPDPMTKVAIDKASHFVREQRKQSSNTNNINVP